MHAGREVRQLKHGDNVCSSIPHALDILLTYALIDTSHAPPRCFQPCDRIPKRQKTAAPCLYKRANLFVFQQNGNRSHDDTKRVLLGAKKEGHVLRTPPSQDHPVCLLLPRTGLTSVVPRAADDKDTGLRRVHLGNRAGDAQPRKLHQLTGQLGCGKAQAEASVLT